MPNSDSTKADREYSIAATSDTDSKFLLLFIRFKKPLLVLCMILCVLVGFSAFKLMMADIKGYQAKRMIVRFEKHNKITSQADLDHAYSNIQSARWWAPKIS